MHIVKIVKRAKYKQSKIQTVLYHIYVDTCCKADKIVSHFICLENTS